MTDKITSALKKYKYPLLVLMLGLILILLPTGSLKKESSQDLSTDIESRFERVLERCDGVGEAYVLISDDGIVIVCDGASRAEVKYAVTKAAEAFTGFSGDRIQILRTGTITGGAK